MGRRPETDAMVPADAAKPGYDRPSAQLRWAIGEYFRSV